MLALDKRKDISVLYAMGATPGIIRKIFLYEGMIIAFTGAIFGVFLGVATVLAQENFGFVGMGMETAVTSAYPVKLIFSDLIFTGLCTAVITILASLHPARQAVRTSVIQHI